MRISEREPGAAIDMPVAKGRAGDPTRANLVSTMLFTVDRLSKKFGPIAALEDVNFGVRAGEVLGLIGPNGAGKSTLLECMAGVLPADRGAILTEGRVLRERERRSLLFYVPDGVSPWSSQPVGWALSFVAGFFRGRTAIRNEVIEGLDLGQVLNQSIGTLSKGQRKRALLAIGLLTPQPALLIDEPFEGLDLRQAQGIAQFLRAQAAAGRTLLLSIHQIGDAARFCDRFVLLSGGRVRGEGTVGELAGLAMERDASRSYENLEEVFLALT